MQLLLDQSYSETSGSMKTKVYIFLYSKNMYLKSMVIVDLANWYRFDSKFQTFLHKIKLCVSYIHDCSKTVPGFQHLNTASSTYFEDKVNM